MSSFAFLSAIKLTPPVRTLPVAAACLALCPAVVLAQRGATELAEPLAIMGGTLIDGTDAPPIENAYVFVANGRVEDAGCCADQVDAPEGYEIIDASGMTVMPGLIDGHVHVGREGVPDATGLQACLDAGITTLRDLGVSLSFVGPVIRDSERLGAENLVPEVVWAGPMITAPGGYPLTAPPYARTGQAVKSAEEAVRLVNDLEEVGARVIKLGLERGYYRDEGWELLDVAIVQAIAERAHEHGMRVTAHVTDPDEVRLALDGGLDGLAHAPLERLSDDLIAEMIGRDLAMVTTATAWGESTARQIAAENAKRYAEAGGIVAIGTDFGCFGELAGIERYLAELRFLNAAGISKQQLLQGATRNGAIVANVAEIGTIGAGKRADVIIVDGDPLADLGALRNVVTVLKAGRGTEPVPRPRTTPQPGSEAAVRRMIEEVARGEPNYELLSPQLAQVMREQLSSLQGTFESLGAIESIRFQYGALRGADVYEVQLANGLLVFWIMLDENGRTTMASFLRGTAAQ